MTKQNINVLRSQITTISETSKIDGRGNNAVYFSSSKKQAINFDKIKDWYKDKNSLLYAPKSADAFCIDSKGNQIFIEFKSGNIFNAKAIKSIVEKAYHTLTEAEEETYFQIIRKMLGKYAAPQEGEICFSKKDLERMPKGFEKEIQAIARENKGDLVLSKETREIGGGFILIYGGIEENCSFQAMFNARKDELSDKVHEILFS